MRLLPLSPAPENLPPGTPPPWPAPALVKPPPAPKRHRWVLIGTALSALVGPFCVGAMLWMTDKGGDSVSGAVVAILSLLLVVGLVVLNRWEQHQLPARQRAHDAVLKNLVTCWARVRSCAIVASENSEDGFLTHHVLEIELEPWRDEPTPIARSTPNSSERWQVRWRVVTELATHVVPGTWVAVAYDRREPDSRDTKFMQLLVTLSGAVHPLA